MTTQPKPGAVIFVKDVANLADFYQRLFMLSVKHQQVDKVVLESETFMLVIHGIPDDIANTIVITSPPEIRESTPIKLFLPVKRIAEARSLAASLGGFIRPVEFEWSAGNFNACDGVDPEGNVFQVREAKS